MQGIGVSPGISIGRAYVMRQQKLVASGVLLPDQGAVQEEIEKYDRAVRLSVEEVLRLSAAVPAGEAAILEVQLELLQDPQMVSDILDKIKVDRLTARDAVLLVTELAVQVFEQMEDEYLKARAADVQDAGHRIIKNLLGISAGVGPEEGVILIAEDLSPSDTIGMDRTKVRGFATQVGGRTSHAAIVARMRGLPAVVGVGVALGDVMDGDLVILDGMEGVVLVNPVASVVVEYVQKREELLVETRRLQRLKDWPAVTSGGIRVDLLANIASAADMDEALAHGAEGVGLLRTELLFMERASWPTEEEQFEYYKTILVRAAGRMVTIRTLDIGGDKPLPYFPLPKEENPFLGYRAIRICLDRPEIFLPQLRAILRASVFGKCRILLPMISSVEEVWKAKGLLAEAKTALVSAGIVFDTSIGIGIMIEIPAAAVIADLLAKEVDFFSIGTNDLCQYVLAADRMNGQIKELYDPMHPAVLRLIRTVIDAGHLQGIPVGMCGEMAGDPRATEVLLKMGLREFSMSAGAILGVKDRILKSKL